MPEPNELQALQNLQTALAGIKTTAGYHNDVADVSQVKLDPDATIDQFVTAPVTRPMVLLEVGKEQWTYPEMPARVRITMPVNIHFVRPTDATDDADRLREFFRACSDVEKALATDFTRGGFASLTTITERAMRNQLGSELWAIVSAELRFNRTFGQADV